MELTTRDAQPVLRCLAGQREAVLPAAFEADAWLFVACAWEENTGVHLWSEDAAGSADAADEEPFAPGPAPIEGLRVAPRWALVGEVRLHRHALSEDEVVALLEETRGSYR